MAIFSKKHKLVKATLVMLVVLCAVVFIGHSFVFAQSGSSTAKVDAQAGSSETSITSIGLAPILYVIRVALTAVYFLVGNTLIKLGGYLASLSLELNNTILTFDPPFVLTGWVIFRDIANLGFVFGIIVIAMATILRIQGYQAQKILLKLIAAALLVNFSLVIAGSVLRIAQVFSDFFMNRIAGGSAAAIGAKLVDQLGFARIGLQPDQGAFDAIKTLLTSGTASIMFEIASLGVIVAFAVLTFITLLAFAGMLFIRYFQLSFLLMLSPIVWLLWIFPHTKGYWQKWWKNFLHWVFYAPFMLLFVWLALTVMASGGSKYKEYAERAVTPTTGGGLTVSGIAGISFGDLMQNIMAMAILLGGMKVAQSMGYGGTALVMNSAQKMGGWAKTKATRGAARFGSAVYRKTGMEKAITSRTPTSWLGRKIVGGLQRGVVRTGAGLEKVAGGGVDDSLKRYGGYSKERLQAIAGTVTGADRNAVAVLLQRKKGLDADTMQKLTGKNTSQEAEKAILALKNQFNSMGKGEEFASIENTVGKTAEIQKAQDDYVSAVTNDARDEALARLKAEKDKFARRLRDEDWQSIGKTLSRQPQNTGEAEYQKLFADEITRDLSGRKFYRAFAGVEGEQIHGYVGSLVTNSNSVMSGLFPPGTYPSVAELQDVKDELEEAQKSGDYGKVIKRLKGSGNSYCAGLANQLSRSIVEGVVGSAFAGPRMPAPPGGPTPTVPPSPWSAAAPKTP